MSRSARKHNHRNSAPSRKCSCHFFVASVPSHGCGKNPKGDVTKNSILHSRGPMTWQRPSRAHASRSMLPTLPKAWGYHFLILCGPRLGDRMPCDLLRYETNSQTHFLIIVSVLMRDVLPLGLRLCDPSCWLQGALHKNTGLNKANKEKP